MTQTPRKARTFVSAEEFASGHSRRKPTLPSLFLSRSLSISFSCHVLLSNLLSFPFLYIYPQTMLLRPLEEDCRPADGAFDRLRVSLGLLSTPVAAPGMLS